MFEISIIDQILLSLDMRARRVYLVCIN